MKVLGLDPGSQRLGYGVVAREGARWRRLGGGTVRLRPGSRLSGRLASIYAAVSRVVADYSPDLVAVEEIFVARSPHAALVLGQVRGVLLLAIEQAGIPLCELAPRKVKLAAVGNGGAAKAQVQYMVPRLLEGCPAAMGEDEADALAIAWCAANRAILESASETGGVRPTTPRGSGGAARTPGAAPQLSPEGVGFIGRPSSRRGTR